MSIGLEGVVHSFAKGWQPAVNRQTKRTNPDRQSLWIALGLFSCAAWFDALRTTKPEPTTRTTFRAWCPDGLDGLCVAAGGGGG
eukprot:COSAG04_NODE_6620_length_1291_cov_1.478188_3_plen_84_part_00